MYVTWASSSSVTAIGVATGIERNATGVRGHLTNALLAVAAAGAAGLLLLPTSASSARSAPFLFVNMAALGALLVVERRRPTLRRGLVLAVAGALLVLAVAMPERRSRDLWSYAVYGGMVADHGLNPYTHTPDDVAGDPFTDRINPVWRDRICLYGPLFVAIAAGVVTVTGSSALATRLAFQGLAALAVFIALLVIDRRKRDPAAVALVALHPAVLLYGVAGGHNDALVGLAVLGACVLAVDRRHVLAGLCVAAAALIKAVAGLALLPLAAWVWRRHGRRPAVTMTAVGTGVALAGQLTGGRAAFDSLLGLRGEVSWSSMWRWWIYTRAEPGSRMDEALRLGRPMLAITLVVVFVVVLRRQGEDHPALPVGAALAAYVVAAPYSIVWYLGWALPALALRWRTTTTAVVLAWSAVLLVAAEWSYPSGRGPGWLYFATLVAAVALALTGRGRYSPGPPAVVPPPRARPARAG